MTFVVRLVHVSLEHVYRRINIVSKSLIIAGTFLCDQLFSSYFVDLVFFSTPFSTINFPIVHVKDPQINSNNKKN